MTKRDDIARAHIDRASEALRRRPTDVDPVRRARLLANIEAAERRDAAPWMKWSLAAGLAAAAVAAVVVLMPTEPAPRSLAMTAKSGSGTIAFDYEAAYASTPTPKLTEGRATLVMPNVPPPKDPVRLETPHATVELEDGRATVVVLDGVTRLEVIAGRATWIVAGRSEIVEASERVATRTTVAARAPNVEAPKIEAPPQPTEAVERPAPKEAPAKRPKKTVATAKRVEVAPAPKAPAPKPAEEPGSAPLATRTAPPPPDKTKEDRAKVDRARALVRRDAARAEQMAEEVLEQAPAPEVEASALMVVADVRRRANDPAVAARLYARVTRLPEGAELHEEALLRRAELLAKIGRTDEALAALSRAKNVATRALWPERLALEVGLVGARDGAGAAAKLAATHAEVGGAAMGRARLEIAKQLASSNPSAAIELLDAIDEHGGSRATLTEAKSLREEIEDS